MSRGLTVNKWEVMAARMEAKAAGAAAVASEGMSDAALKIELLKTELARAEEAELHSDEQLRGLTGSIDAASAPNAKISASDCSKLVSAALALNAHLRSSTSKLRSALNDAQRRG